jgi:hypothetical protein
LAAATAAGHRILQLGLAPPVSAAARHSLTLLLELTELTPRIFDAIIHLQALRGPVQPAAEDEEALEAIGILHGGLGALEYAVGLGDLLVDTRNVIAVGPSSALRGNEVLLQLHAADLLVALSQSEAGAANHRRGAQRKHGEARAADRPHRRREQAPKIAMNAHDWFRSPGSPATHYARLKSGVNAASIR